MHSINPAYSAYSRSEESVKSELLEERIRYSYSDSRLSFVFGRAVEEERESLQTWGFTKVYKVLIKEKLATVDVGEH